VLGVISREGGLLSGDMIERGMFRCCEVENHQWVITGEKFWEWIVDMKKKMFFKKAVDCSSIGIPGCLSVGTCEG
jgi:hypothetical protein